MKASVFLIYFKILDVFGNASLISAHRGRCFSDFKVNFPPNFCDFVSYSIIESYIITSYDKMHSSPNPCKRVQNDIALQSGRRHIT